MEAQPSGSLTRSRLACTNVLKSRERCEAITSRVGQSGFCIRARLQEPALSAAPKARSRMGAVITA
jgi:hypothetical protein